MVVRDIFEAHDDEREADLPEKERGKPEYIKKANFAHFECGTIGRESRIS
jgi:hypothetical protein